MRSLVGGMLLGLFVAAPSFAAPRSFSGELSRIVSLPERERLAAQSALAKRGDEVLSPLAAAAQDRTLPEAESQVVMFVLGEMGSSGACAALPDERSLEGRSAAIGLAAAVARGRCGSTAALQLRLGSVDPRVRAKAAVTLGLLGAKEALVQVVAASSDPVNRDFVTFWALARGLMGDGSVSDVVEVLERQPATARLAWLARMRSAPLGVSVPWDGAWLQEADPIIGEALVGEFLRRCTTVAPDVRQAAAARWPRLAPAFAKGCAVAPP